MSSAIAMMPGSGYTPTPSQVTYVLDSAQRLQYKTQQATAQVNGTHAPNAPTTLDLAVTLGATTLYLKNIPQGNENCPGTWYVSGETFTGSPF